MANLLPENETYEFEDRTYVNPNVSLDEQTSFIDNFRTAQAQNNQEINTDTYNLGTAAPSNLGGLTGGDGYWTSRYQTPQTEVLVNNLRTAAQAKALNDVLANEQAMWKQRYQKAYNAAKIRSSNSGGGSGGDGSNKSNWDGEVDKKATDGENKDNNNNENQKTTTPPNPEDYYIDGREQTERIQERTGLPDWLINQIKLFG